jgi:hypothetical protein
VTSDWTILLLGLVALAGVSAVTVFAIGLDSEAVHVIFMVSGLLAAWGILSVLSGFGSVNSFWGELDSSGLSLGTIMFGLLSLVYFIGTLKAVSRGE